MSDAGSMLAETADRLFADLSPTGDEAFERVWPAIADAGFPSLMVAEADGGFDGGWPECFLVQRLAGYHALAAPLGECALALHLLDSEDAPGADGLATIAAGAEGERIGGSFSGRLSGVPWGRYATCVVAQHRGTLLAIGVAGGRIQAGENLAGEPRDAITVRTAPSVELKRSTDLFALGALLRIGQIAGALDRAFELSVAYANERIQFGKPLAKFQAVQQGLATVAEAAAAVNSAGQSAAAAQARGDALFEVAAAKLRADMAVDLGAAMTHQVHGAIGFTQDYALHRFTRRLQSWRGEFGNDRHWAERLGRMVSTEWSGNIWAGLTRRGDA